MELHIVIVRFEMPSVYLSVWMLSLLEPEQLVRLSSYLVFTVLSVISLCLVNVNGLAPRINTLQMRPEIQNGMIFLKIASSCHIYKVSKLAYII
jgi:hypothetical protein